MKRRGQFITFEGGEGAGKSTQARLLKAALEARGKNVTLTREPGGSEGAGQIRKVLVEGEPKRASVRAAPGHDVVRLIEPALKSGTWVISDRFADSTFVYQGIARGLGTK